MILAVDVYYFSSQAKTVGVLFNQWQDKESTGTLLSYSENVSAYESSYFYKRELPCILKLLESVDLSTIDVIIVDGYVHLDEMKKGLLLV